MQEMNNILTVKNLCKQYPGFKLDNVAFSLEEGKITGFIGRNGAGKTTTLKSILNLIHPDAGEIAFFGKNFEENQAEFKQNIGFVAGGVNYYPAKKLKVITAVTKRFYVNWDDNALNEYMKLFNLDPEKTPLQLSDGMKVKYSLATALSHNAKILLLDEPTSGLDPISRDELLDIFLSLSDKGITILFSTHITSDLDKCADNIVYIKNGRIIAESGLDKLISSYKLVETDTDDLPLDIKSKLIGLKRAKKGYTAIVKTDESKGLGLTLKDTDLDEIMVHLDKEDI